MQIRWKYILVVFVMGICSLPLYLYAGASVFAPVASTLAAYQQNTLDTQRKDAEKNMRRILKKVIKGSRMFMVSDSPQKNIPDALYRSMEITFEYMRDLMTTRALNPIEIKTVLDGCDKVAGNLCILNDILNNKSDYVLLVRPVKKGNVYSIKKRGQKKPLFTFRIYYREEQNAVIRMNGTNGRMWRLDGVIERSEFQVVIDLPSRILYDKQKTGMHIHTGRSATYHHAGLLPGFDNDPAAWNETVCMIDKKLFNAYILQSRQKELTIYPPDATELLRAA